MVDNKKTKLIKFEDWAEDYFNNEEDPNNKDNAKTFHEYCLSNSRYSEKRKYNYIDGLRKRILRRIQIIHGEYIGMYIKDYGFSEKCYNENIKINNSLIHKNYYEEILDTYLPESDLNNKSLTICRRIARKHYERYDELKLQLENVYNKLPFKISSEKIDEILNKIYCTTDIDNIFHKDITEEQKDRFYSKYNKYFKSRKHSDKCLKIFLKIKDLEDRINRCGILFQKAVDNYYTIDIITEDNRFKYITNDEAEAYINILKIMNSQKFPQTNLLRRLDDGYWELLDNDQITCLIESIDVLQETENWNDVCFKIEDIEEKLRKPVKVRNITKLKKILDLAYDSEDFYDDKVLQEIDKLIEQTDKYIHKFFCKYKKIVNKTKEIDFTTILEQSLAEREKEKNQKINELHLKNPSKLAIAYNPKHRNDNKSK